MDEKANNMGWTSRNKEKFDWMMLAGLIRVGLFVLHEITPRSIPVLASYLSIQSQIGPLT
ncbi:hypothetical protein WUBG_13846, partial [Wuchereria bancrofti]